MVWILKNVFSGKEHFVSSGKFTVGRKYDADLVCYNGAVSKNQALLHVDGNSVCVVDQDSQNGTFVNRKKLPAHQVSPLRNGDEIGFGMYRHSNGTMSQIFKEPYLVFTLVHREFIDVQDDSCSNVSSLAVSEPNNNAQDEETDKSDDDSKVKHEKKKDDNLGIGQGEIVATKGEASKVVANDRGKSAPAKQQSPFEEEAKRRKGETAPKVEAPKEAENPNKSNVVVQANTKKGEKTKQVVAKQTMQKADKLEDDLFAELDESMCSELTVPGPSKSLSTRPNGVKKVGGESSESPKKEVTPKNTKTLATSKNNKKEATAKNHKKGATMKNNTKEATVKSVNKVETTKSDSKEATTKNDKKEGTTKKVVASNSNKKEATPKNAKKEATTRSAGKKNLTPKVAKKSAKKEEAAKSETSRSSVKEETLIRVEKEEVSRNDEKEKPLRCVVQLEKIRVKDMGELQKRDEATKRESRKRSLLDEPKVVEEKRARQSDATTVEKGQTAEKMNNSYSVEDEVIIINDDDDDDEEDFMLSQVFVKEEPQEPSGSSSGGVDEAVFKTIKMEISEMDQLEDYSTIPPIVVDSQDFGLGPDDEEFLETIYGKEAELRSPKKEAEEPIEPPLPDDFNKVVDYNNVDIVYDGVDNASDAGSFTSDNALMIDEAVNPVEPGPSRVNGERPYKIPRKDENVKPRGKSHVKMSSSRGDFLLDGASSSSSRPWNRSRKNARCNSPADSLLPVVMRYKNRSRRLLDEYGGLISSILTWNKSWFDEQTHNSAPPPVSKKNVISMCRTFASYKDYFDVVHPLITLDLWYQISKDFQGDTEHRNSKKSFNSRVVSVNQCDRYMEVVCNSYLNAKDYSTGNHLKEKHLVNVVLKNGSTAWIRFGVVAWTDKAKFKPEDFIDIEEAKKCKPHPVGRLTFMLIVKTCAVTVSTPAVGRYFASLCNYLRQYSNLISLKSSPLLGYILDPKEENHVKLKPLNRPVAKHHMELNQSQTEAVLESAALISSPVNGIYLIDGPPGTGKSTVITTVVLEAILKHKVLLLLAPSNGAIDSLVEKLTTQIKPVFEKENRERIRLVRIGSNSTSSKASRYTLDSIARFNIKNNTLQSHQAVRKDYGDLGTDLALLKKKWQQCTDNENIKALYHKKRKEHEDFFVKVLGQQRYNSELESQKQSLLKGANVICSTIGSCTKLHMYGYDFKQITACIVDEASQCCEVDTLLPLCQGINKLILVGDAKQLPAVTSSTLTSMFGYGQSLFARLKTNLERYNVYPKLLDVQYRMNPEISLYPNRTFYQSRLKDAPGFATKPGLENLKPYMVFGQATANRNVYRNYNEVICIRNLLQAILEVAKPCKFSIGIITPYVDQKEALNVILSKSNFEGIEIICNTIDGFQGQEKDIILISCVRNMTNSFLEDEKRLNVALTRAKHALYIIGNQTLFESSKTLRSLHLDAVKRNAYCKLLRADFDSSVFASQIFRPSR